MGTIVRASFVLVLASFSSTSARAQQDLWERLNAQAMDLHRQKRDDEAAATARETLAVAEKTFDPSSPKLAISLTNLADIYRSQVRYADAEPLYRRASEIVGKAFGSQHPKMARALDNLGNLYEAWGRPADAEPLYRRALDINQKGHRGDSLFIPVSLLKLAGNFPAVLRCDDVSALSLHAPRNFL